MAVAAPNLEPFRTAAADPKGLVHAIKERFDEHELLLRASAIGFQLLTVLVPFALFTAALLGFLGLEDVYVRDVMPEIEKSLSIPAFTLVNDTIRKVLGQQSLVWMTLGLGIALWQLSGLVRTVGSVLDQVYEHEDTRRWPERLLRSGWIAAAIAVCIIGALLAAAVSPLLYGDVGPVAGTGLWLVRYAAAAVLLLVAVGVVVHHAPSERRPVEWVSFGAVLVTVAWLVVTTVFGAYAAGIASVGSIYGVFVSVVVLLAWVYASSLAFVAGIAADDALRSRG